MKNRSHGFTLMELMVTLAIAATVIGIGVPSYREFSRNSRMVSVANDILGGVLTARTEAIKRQMPLGGISVCPTDDPEASSPTCASDTTRNFNGWIVFTDPDSDCDRTGTEEVIRIGQRIDLGNTPMQHVNSYSNGACFSFGATGFLVATKRAAATRVIFCDERGNATQAGMNLSVARGLEVTATGRARITRDPTELATWTDAKCP